MQFFSTSLIFFYSLFSVHSAAKKPHEKVCSFSQEAVTLSLGIKGSGTGQVGSSGPTNGGGFQLISICQPSLDSIFLNPVLPAGGTWSADCGSCVSAQGVFNPAGLMTGDYQILYLQNGITDTFLVSIFPQPAITIMGQDSADVREAVSLTANGGVSYTWMPAGSLSCSDCTNPIFTADSTTVFTVTGTDANGCMDVDTLTVNVRPEIKFDIPNAFTPNGDQANDVFRPVFKGAIFTEYHLYVYDRWGERVFETYTPGEGWDGNVFEQPLASDVYLYVFEYQLINGQKGVDKKEVTLLR